jgi:hypothetical protein
VTIDALNFILLIGCLSVPICFLQFIDEVMLLAETLPEVDNNFHAIT